MELINERKKIILDLMNDKNYVPMKIKELAIILNVKKEDRGLLEIVLNELINEAEALTELYNLATKKIK